MKIYVLGHKGFLGLHLLPKLLSLGHEVVSDMRYFDDKYDAIINLAAVTHIRNEFDAKMIESNIILVDKVFKRSERIIQASSCSAAHLTNPYSLTKLWAEHLVKKHGNAIGLRLHNCYGPNNNKGLIWFLQNCIDGQKITIRGPELIRDYIHSDDVVNEIIRHLKPDGRFINLCHAREKAKKEERDVREILNEFFLKGNLEHIDLIATKGVVEVGTGIGLQTMDVVNLYQKLSGKTFDISVVDAGENEPERMVSNEPITNSIDLETGLLKMINN